MYNLRPIIGQVTTQIRPQKENHSILVTQRDTKRI